MAENYFWTFSHYLLKNKKRRTAAGDLKDIPFPSILNERESWKIILYQN